MWRQIYYDEEGNMPIVKLTEMDEIRHLSGEIKEVSFVRALLDYPQPSPAFSLSQLRDTKKLAKVDAILGLI